jgi:hypothetical protein
MYGRNGNIGFVRLFGIKFKLDFHCRGRRQPSIWLELEKLLGIKKSSIGGNQYLVYLWELACSQTTLLVVLAYL